MPVDELAAALTEFVTFARKLRGDEKSESQSSRTLLPAQLELIKGPGVRAKGGKKAMACHQLADRRCCRGIISELKQLRNDRILMV